MISNMSRLLAASVAGAVVASSFSVRATERIEASRAVAVRVIDLAGVPLTTRRRALEQAARLFERIGVTIVWDPSPRVTSSLEAPFAVELTVLDGRSNPSNTGHVVGSSTLLPVVPTISVFYRDVQEVAEVDVTSTESLFGFVIAHELGHLLLGLHAHSGWGLMKPCWNRTDVAHGVAQGQFRFSAREGERIRRRLR